MRVIAHSRAATNIIWALTTAANRHFAGGGNGLLAIRSKQRLEIGKRPPLASDVNHRADKESNHVM